MPSTKNQIAMKTLWALSLVIGLLLVGWPATGLAQRDSMLLANVTEEEQAAINALVLYPETTRQHILIASLHPEALIKLENIQANTQDAFTELLRPLPQETQEQLWDLTRYPGLVARLAALPPADAAALQEVLAEYPEAITDGATRAYTQHRSLLRQIEALENTAATTAAAVLDPYEASVRESLSALIQMPEVLSLLTEQLRLTVLLGDQYRSQPERVLRELDSLHLVVARNNATELADWRASLEQNPEIADELGYAAESYTETSEYDDLYYDPAAVSDPPRAVDEEDYEDEAVTVPYYYDYPYPYWFGYPYWFDYPRWRPYPLWYEWGFIYRPHRGIVVFRLPSYHFVSWYFGYPYHHVWWPGLSATFVRHYYHHRHYTSGITAGVGIWYRRNQSVISDRWLRDDGRLVQRFREYGEFEVDRQRYNERRPRRAMAPQTYLERNGQRYPELNRTAPRTRSADTPAPTRTTPRRREGTADEPVPTPRTRTAPTRPTRTQEPATREPAPQAPRIRSGEEYHRNTIRRTVPSRPRTSTAPSRTPATPRAGTARPTQPPTRKKSGRKRSGGGER
jgi:hypothetical protein